MATSMIGTYLTYPRKLLKGFTVQELPDHSNIKQCCPSTIMFAWESSYDLGSSRGASLELDKSAIKADICSFGRSEPFSLPSSELVSGE